MAAVQNMNMQQSHARTHDRQVIKSEYDILSTGTTISISELTKL